MPVARRFSCEGENVHPREKTVAQRTSSPHSRDLDDILGSRPECDESSVKKNRQAALNR
jgi:hypothetical protein